MPEISELPKNTWASLIIWFIWPPMWKECLESDTYQKGKGSTVARVTDGSVYPHALTAMASG